jgi:hypothetical protein
MKNMQQVKRGQLIETPHGIGYVSYFWPMQEGEKVNQVAYGVYLLQGRAPEYGYPFYSASELRPLNPSTFFPAHKGEILL